MTAPHNRCRWFLEGNQCIHDTGHPGPHEAVVPRLVEFHEPFTDDEGEHRPRRGPGPIITRGRCHTPGCSRPVTGERRYCGPCAARRYFNGSGGSRKRRTA